MANIHSSHTAYILFDVIYILMTNNIFYYTREDNPVRQPHCTQSNITVIRVKICKFSFYSTNGISIMSYFSGAAVCLSPIVCLEIGGFDNLAAVYGFVLMCSGVSRISGVPIMGIQSCLINVVLYK